jgi:hypothetical protein
MRNYTGEELKRAQDAKDQQLTFNNEVKRNVDAQVERGEAPSETRMNINFGLTLPAIAKTAKTFIWDTPAPRPLGTPVEAATRELFQKSE